MLDHSQTGPNSSESPPPGQDPLDLQALTEMLLRDPALHAKWVVREIERFSTTFPEIETPQNAIPRFTWEQLERQLMFLAGTPQRQAMVSDRVASIRNGAVHKPEEMILQEILIEAWVLLDEEPHGPVEEEGLMT